MSRIRVRAHDASGEVGPATLPGDVPSRLVADELARFLYGEFASSGPGGEPAHAIAFGAARRLAAPDETLTEAGLADGDDVWLVDAQGALPPVRPRRREASIALRPAAQPPRPRRAEIVLERGARPEPPPRPGIALAARSVAVKGDAPRRQSQSDPGAKVELPRPVPR